MWPPRIRCSNCLGHAVCPGEPDMANISLKAHFGVLCFWEKTLFLAADMWKNAGEKRFQMHWPWGPSVSNAEGAKGDQLHECHSFCWEQLSHPHKSPKGNKQMPVGSRLYPLKMVCCLLLPGSGTAVVLGTVCTIMSCLCLVCRSAQVLHLKISEMTREAQLVSKCSLCP